MGIGGNGNNLPRNESDNAINSNVAVADSMAVFLKAEEMSTKECTESQILNTVKDINNNNNNVLSIKHV